MLSLSERVAAYRRAPVVYRRELPLLCLIYLFLARFAAHDLRPEHLLAAGLAFGLGFFSDGSRKLARVGLPFILWVSVYDSMRWYADAIRSPLIHIHEPYDFDLRFFGIAGQTPNEWLQKHTANVLDFVCGLSYTPFFFVGESILLAIWMQFHGMERRAQRFAWVFVIANFVGFSFYYIYPAAPPWYVAEHGFLLDLSVRASPAGTVRFDQLVGMPIMQGFYSKSADVFGAIPSLHIVYPFLALVYSIQLRRFRIVALAYWLLVCFSAVYLNHHYVLDLFAGLAIAITVSLAFRAAFGPLGAPNPVAAAGTIPAGEPA